MDKLDLILEEARIAFEAEQERTGRLSGGTEKQVGAAGLLVAANIMSFGGELQPVTHGTAIQLVAMVGFGICLLLLLYSLRVRPYVAQSRENILLDELGPEEIDAEVAKVKIAKMYLSARELNAKINDKRAKELHIIGMILSGAFLLAVSGIIIDMLLM
jgi:hypothetical protein